MYNYRKFFKLAGLPLVAFALLLAGMGPVRAQTVYKFGVVPQFAPRKLASVWTPILNDLETRTGLTFKMVGSPKIPDFEMSFLAGAFDFAYMNPYHAMLASSKQGYVPINRDHGRKLFGVLVVKKDSPIQDIRALDGESLSFPAPNALGASLLMRAELARNVGITMKPIYTQTHSSVYLNVIFGKTPAGGGVMGSLKRQGKEIQDGLRVLYKTREMVPHPVTAHPRVPVEHREKVRAAFLAMGRSVEGAAMLAKVPFKKIGPASPDEYSDLKTWGLEEFYVAKK
jgi:phosphonate transport system substrate-binding protein